MTASEIEDPELARYLNRSYWEQKQQEKDSRDKESELPIYPSAPVTAAGPMSPTNNGIKVAEVLELVAECGNSCKLIKIL